MTEFWNVLESAGRLEPSTVTASFAAGGCAAGTLLLLSIRRHVAETTLLGPWQWALVSLWAVAACEMVAGLASGRRNLFWLEPARFAAAVLTVCPLMALLGAKRPQDRPWKYVVLSLWAVLSLPALQGVLLSRGAGFDVHPLRGWLLSGLILLGVVNFLPTRLRWSAISGGIGQVLLLSQHLPVPARALGTPGALGGLFTICVTLALASLALRLPRPVPQSLDRLWLDYRDLFGILWSLRVAERINASSQANGWCLTLDWRGFRVTGEFRSLDSLPLETRRSLERHVQSLLRRFVSRNWIGTRMSQQVN